VDGSTCEVVYGAYGQHAVVTTYVSGADSVTTGPVSVDFPAPIEAPAPPVLPPPLAQAAVSATRWLNTACDGGGVGMLCLVATVTGSAGVPTGSVCVAPEDPYGQPDPADQVCGQLTGGVAQITVSASYVWAGPNVTVAYSGDGSYAPATQSGVD
jgi:hypothetical protein